MKRRALRLLLVGVLVGTCFVGAGSAFHQPAAQTAADRAVTNGTVAPKYAGDAARQGIRVGVRANGSAVVLVRYRLALTDANETAAFERLRANVTANPARYRTRFGTRMNRVVASAQASTGREMAATNYTVDATRRGATGIVTYSFVWRGFAASERNRLRVGDALAGLYLDNETRLTVTWPAEYTPTAVRPPFDERRTNGGRWTAPTAFGESEPFVELVPANSSPNARSTSNTSNASGGAGDGAATDSPRGTSSGSNASGGADGQSGTGPLLTVAAVGVVLGGLALAAWLLRGRRGDTGQSPSASATTGPETSDTEPSESPTEPSEPPTESTQAELLSNEERVVRVLERAGGRAKQQHVVEELGWTEAKTSQVVKRLREEGTVAGFRLGRENVLVIPDEDGEGDAAG